MHGDNKHFPKLINQWWPIQISLLLRTPTEIHCGMQEKWLSAHQLPFMVVWCVLYVNSLCEIVCFSNWLKRVDPNLLCFFFIASCAQICWCWVHIYENIKNHITHLISLWSVAPLVSIPESAPAAGSWVGLCWSTNNELVWALRQDGKPLSLPKQIKNLGRNICIWKVVYSSSTH